MIELLKLCGFQEQEIEAELPRVDKAFAKLGINTEDIERGKQRLKHRALIYLVRHWYLNPARCFRYIIVGLFT